MGTYKTLDRPGHRTTDAVIPRVMHISDALSEGWLLFFHQEALNEDSTQSMHTCVASFMSIKIDKY